MSDQAVATPPLSTEPSGANPSATPPAQQEGQPSQPQWMNWISDPKIKESGVIKNLSAHTEPEKAFAELAKMYVNVQPLIGRGGLKQDSTDEEVLQFRNQFTPGGKEKFKPIQGLNGTKLPDEVNELLLDFASSRKLSQADYEAAQKMLLDGVANAPIAMKADLAEKYGEANVQKIMDSSDRIIKMLPQELQNVTNEMLGNNSVFRQVMAFMSQYFGESSYSETGAGIPSSQPSAPAKKDYNAEINQANADYIKAYREAGNNQYDPNVIQAQKKLNELMNKQYRQM